MNDTARMVLGPIIGGLSHDRVNLWARADRPSTLYAWVATKRDKSDARLKGRTQLTDATGCAGVVTISRLKPAAKYYFALTLDPKLIPPKTAFRPFTTFPAPGKAASFRFAFGSCFRPEKTDAGRAFEHMLKNQRGLSFLLMLGDQIYADEWEYNGLGRVAQNLNDYRAVYVNTWSNRHHRALLAQTPVFMTLDDHEVDNDWHWHDFEHTSADIPLYTKILRFLNGRTEEEYALKAERAHPALVANWEHQVMHAPAKLSPMGPLAYEFEYGAAAFFIMDTRTQRVVNRQVKSILGESQWNQLFDWLERVKETHPVKFIVTSTSILSRLIGDVTAERWSGLKDERDRLLHFLAAQGIRGVYFLAGDLHSAHSISADLYGPGGTPIKIWEFCSSPFEQKPNRLAWLLGHPAKSPALRNQERHFVVSEINYGIVEVDLSNAMEPKVSFQLHYQKGDAWHVKSG